MIVYAIKKKAKLQDCEENVLINSYQITVFKKKKMAKYCLELSGDREAKIVKIKIEEVEESDVKS
jgi:hypothetical protein